MEAWAGAPEVRLCGRVRSDPAPWVAGREAGAAAKRNVRIFWALHPLHLPALAVAVAVAVAADRAGARCLQAEAAVVAAPPAAAQA